MCGSRGAIAGLDRAGRTVGIAPVHGPDGEELLPARRIPYDALVVALGSRANDFGTPGVAEHCLFLDTLDEADRFNTRFREETLRAAVPRASNLPPSCTVPAT